MTNPDTKINNSSSLSAEAATFVPSHMKHGKLTEAPSLNKSVDPQLPHYMTSCYPFVASADNSFPTRSSATNWQQRGNTSTNQSSHLHAPFPSPGMLTFSGSRPPGPQNFNHRMPNLQHGCHPLHQQNPHLTSPLSPPHQQQQQNHHRFPPPQASPALPQSQMPGLLPTPSINQALLPTPGTQYRLPVNHQAPSPGVGTTAHQQQVWLSASSHGIYNQGLLTGGQQPGMALPYNPGGARMFEKGKNKKKKGDWHQMVSIGIQKENSIYLANMQGSKRKNRPRTIICMDANVQTDFSDELANKTLAEKPSSIYQKEWTRNWLQLYQDSTTESEEVDSDSGYSSPMHRRNQASSGTHPFTAPESVAGQKYTQNHQPHVPQTQTFQVSIIGQQEAFTGYAQAVISGHNNKNRKQLGENNKTTHHHYQQQNYGVQNNKPSSTSIALSSTAHDSNPAVMLDTSDISIVHPHRTSHQYHTNNTSTHHHKHHLHHQQQPAKQNQSKHHNVNASSSSSINNCVSSKNTLVQSGKCTVVRTGKNSTLESGKNTTYESGKNIAVQSNLQTINSSISSTDENRKKVLSYSEVCNNPPRSASKSMTNISTTSNCSGAGGIENNSASKQSSNNMSVGNSNINRSEAEEDDGATSSGSKHKRKRGRRRRRKSTKSGANSPERQAVGGINDSPYELRRTHSSSNVSRTSTLDNDILHFEDENEFPNLLSAVGGLSDGNLSHQQSLTYSDILKGHHGHALSQESVHSFSSGGFKSSPESVKSSKEGKNARKRRKRQEAVDHAADVELAEITLEQQVLKELSAKSQKTLQIKQEQKQQKQKQQQHSSNNSGEGRGGGGNSGGGKKSKQPMSLSIADMITALEKQQEKDKTTKSEKKSTQKEKTVTNVLDANAPKKRGKERENPKAKRPSPLKKVILKEREEKKRLRLLEDGVTVEVNTEDEEHVKDDDDDEEDDEEEEDEEECSEEQEEPVEEQETVELSQEAHSNRSSLEIGAGGTGTGSGDLSPISQRSPISMSPLSGSPCNSGFSSPIASNSVIGAAVSSSVLTRIHSRRFREYCTQILDKDIDNCCSNLLQELVRFQDRVYHKDPTKAKSKRRIVLGLREVTKHLNLKKIKCVVISPNLERIQSKGGLDEALNNIINECQLQDVPFVFALGRRALGRACAKLVPVSVVGVFSYEGCEEYFKDMMDLTKKARQAYTDMISVMEKEMLEQEKSGTLQPIVPVPINNSSQPQDVLPRLFPHMGHSRTPSACSAISFCSSILSEPISENYPHSEPETDSRGYEIVKDKQGGNGEENNKDTLKEKLNRIEGDEDTQGLNSSGGKVCVVETLQDIDEGHEADTEDDPSGSMNKPRTDGVNNSINNKTLSNYYSVKCNDGVDKSADDLLSLSNSSSSRSQSVSYNYISEDYCKKHVKEDGISGCDDNNTVVTDNGSDTTDTNSQFKDNDIVEDLPYIESIHASDHNAEILSQHSSKTLDLNSEVLSTHSSRTVEAGGSRTPDRSSRNMGSTSDLREASTTSGSNVQKVKTVDKERIESWVLETQKQIEFLNVDDSSEVECVKSSDVRNEHECNGVIIGNSADSYDNINNAEDVDLVNKTISKDKILNNNIRRDCDTENHVNDDFMHNGI